MPERGRGWGISFRDFFIVAVSQGYASVSTAKICPTYKYLLTAYHCL
jgi:hypothetical protein